MYHGVSPQVSSWYQAKGARGELYVSVLNCFGGGVFFGTFLMHMAPEVRRILDKHLLDPYNIHYPLPELATGCGFFMLLFLDKFVTLVGRLCKKSQKNSSNATQRMQKPPITYSKNCDIDGLQDGTNSPHNLRRVATTESIISSISSTMNGFDNPALESNIESAKTITIDSPKYDLDDTASDVSSENEDLATRPYIFLIALTIDCIFEGMSLGLQEDTFSVLMLMVAILSHELVITFSFGLRAIRLFTTKKTAIIILIYTSTIPLGVAIGFSIYESGGGGSATVEVISGFFQAISSGIFIYITFIEILSDELTSSHFSMSRPVAVLVGFVFMALMVLLHSIEEHSGGHSSNSSEYNVSVLAAQPSSSNMTLLSTEV